MSLAKAEIYTITGYILLQKQCLKSKSIVTMAYQ
jgi:hypothetical protein